MIRKPIFQLLTSKYEAFETPESEDPVGKISVTNGFIEQLEIRDDAPQAFMGQILNRLLRSVTEDADKHNSNLSIRITDKDSVRMKRFLERFGFKETHPGIFKRTSGTSIPPSVIW